MSYTYKEWSKDTKLANWLVFLGILSAVAHIGIDIADIKESFIPTSDQLKVNAIGSLAIAFLAIIFQVSSNNKFERNK